MNRKVQINGLYRHFKGWVIKVLGTAIHTETNDILVIYQHIELNDSQNPIDFYGEVYARPIKMFLSEVDRNKYPKVKQKYRFELLEENVDNKCREQLDMEYDICIYKEENKTNND